MASVRSKSEMIASARKRTDHAHFTTRDNDELHKSIWLKPAARCVLKSLHQLLLDWDARLALAHPTTDNTDVCDIAGLDVALHYLQGGRNRQFASGWFESC